MNTRARGRWKSFGTVLTGPIGRIVNYRNILLKTTAVEIRALYAESALGVIWVLIGPLVLLSLYAVIYVLVFKIRPEKLSVADYVLYVFAGLIPIIAFSTSLMGGASSIKASRQVLLNTIFPAELLPVRAVLVNSVVLPVGLSLIAIGCAVFGSASSLLVALLIFPVMVLQIMFLLGVVWVLSLITLAVRDITHMLQYVNIILVIITPIAYTPDMIPANLKLLMYGNPMFYYVTSYQSLLVFGKLPPLHILALGALFAMLSFCGGYWIFQRVKATFYEFA